MENGSETFLGLYFTPFTVGRFPSIILMEAGEILQSKFMSGQQSERLGMYYTCREKCFCTGKTSLEETVLYCFGEVRDFQAFSCFKMYVQVVIPKSGLREMGETYKEDVLTPSAKHIKMTQSFLIIGMLLSM